MVDLRSLIAAAVATATLAGAGALSVVGWSPVSVEAPAVSTVVEPEAVSRNINCSGSVLAAVADSTTWTRIGKVSRGISGGSLAAEFTTDGEPDGAVIAYDGSPDKVAATEYSVVNNDLLAGYLAAECGDPVNSQWLVGGSTTTGRDAVLTISNGSGVDARVDLEFWGAEGPINAPAASGLVIDAGSSASYSLAGFAPNEVSPVVHVVSNGAPVWATLQVSTVRGLDPGGLDRIVSVGEPSIRSVVPVVRQPDEELVGPLRVDPDFADTVTTVRLFAPDGDGTATVTVVPVDGSESTSVTTPVVAGKVLDIAIDELATGDFSIMVDADVPVLAATRFSSYTKSSSIVDMAWSPAIAARIGPAEAYVPVSKSTLVVANTGDSAATVEVNSDGDVTTITVAAHSSESLIVNRGALTVTSDSPVAPGVLIALDGGIATLRLPVEPLGARSVSVVAH
ncbi:MAG: hypothetical protein RLZZ587_955 [Actinomycetota bacterium]